MAIARHELRLRSRCVRPGPSVTFTPQVALVGDEAAGSAAPPMPVGDLVAAGFHHFRSLVPRPRIWRRPRTGRRGDLVVGSGQHQQRRGVRPRSRRSTNESRRRRRAETADRHHRIGTAAERPIIASVCPWRSPPSAFVGRRLGRHPVRPPGRPTARGDRIGFRTRSNQLRPRIRRRLGRHHVNQSPEGDPACHLSAETGSPPWPDNATTTPGSRDPFAHRAACKPPPPSCNRHPPSATAAGARDAFGGVPHTGAVVPASPPPTSPLGRVPSGRPPARPSARRPYIDEHPMWCSVWRLASHDRQLPRTSSRRR